MTQLDDDEAQLLARARRGLGPTSQDRQRVLQSLLPQLTLTPVTPPALSTGPRPSTATWVLRTGFSMAVLGAIALSGGLGYRKGFAAGIAQQTQGAIGAKVMRPAPAIGSTQPALEPAARAQLALATGREPEHESASVPLMASATKAPPTASSARRLRESGAATEPLGLDEEVRQLRRVERAIRESNPRFALVLLEDLERDIPAGQLLEEREAARIMASCQLDADDAVADARAFILKHSGSAYLSRVSEICRVTASPSERISPAPGTDTPK